MINRNKNHTDLCMTFLQSIVSCGSIQSMPVVQFNINGQALTLPASAYVSKVGADKTPNHSIVNSGMNIYGIQSVTPLDVCFHRDTPTVTLVSDMVAHYGSWVTFSSESITPSLTGSYRCLGLPKLCKFCPTVKWFLFYYYFLLRVLCVIICEQLVQIKMWNSK